MERYKITYKLKEILLGFRKNYQNNKQKQKSESDLNISKDNIKLNDNDIEGYLNINPTNLEFYIEKNNDSSIKSLISYNLKDDIMEVKSFDKELSTQLIVQILNIEFPMEYLTKYEKLMDYDQKISEKIMLDNIKDYDSISFKINENDEQIMLNKIRK